MPRALTHFYRAWMAFGLLMGSIVSRVILILFFYVVITPLAYIAYLVGRDELNLTRRNTESYWRIRYKNVSEPSDLDRQY